MEKERERIERMLREGKITKEQSEKLLKALEESAVAEKERRVRKPKTKTVSILITVVALVVIGGLLAVYLPKVKLQRKIDREISQLGTGDRFRALNVIIKIGEPAVPALIEALQDKSNPFTRRWEAAKALGAIKDERAVEPLIKAMSDENEVVRRVTAEALGRLGDKRAIPVLKEALKDPKYYYDKRTGINRYYTRESAAEALEKLEIKVIQRGNEYIVAGQELQEEIPTRDVVAEGERLYQKGPNLLKNSGFEEGTGNKPSNWFKAMVPAPGLKLFWDKKVKYGGKASVAITNTHVYNRVVCNNWAQNITAFPRGKRLELSGYIKTKNAQSVVICAQCWSRDNKMLAFGTTQTTQEISGTTGWAKYTAFITVPEGTNKITVRAVLTGTGQVWFDDIQLAIQ